MKSALSGRIVTMDADYRVIARGVVYLEDRTITAVLDYQAPPPAGFAGVPVIKTRGTLFPGLIDLHNHISYNLLPLWQVDKRYTNRDQWSGTPRYRAHVTGPIRVLGSSPELLAPLARYVECKSLLAGVTSTQGLAMFSNAGVRRYYRGVVRNVEQSLDAELPDAAARIADIETTGAAAFLARQRRTRCMLLHLSEGTDTSAREHFLALRTRDGWAMTPSLAGIHCVALEPEDFDVLGKAGASMVWSPTSNLILYGRTADVFAARRAGVRIGLGADWSTSGTRNLLGELRVARAYARGRIPAREIVSMATRNAASILGWDRTVGTLEPGKRADIIAVAGTSGDPYDALTTADEADIRLVVIDGKPRAGSASLMKALGVTGETVRFGDCRRVVALRDTDADSAVPYVALGQARDTMRTALRRLPDLARDREKHPLTRSPGDPETWYLDLDDPGCAPAPTPRAPSLPLSQLVQPLDLDPLTISGDDDYWARICAQPNLPNDVKEALEECS